MSFGDLFKGSKKDAVDSTIVDEKVEQLETASTKEELKNQNTDKEKEKVCKSEAKTKYMYIALDVKGNVITKQNGEIFTKVAEEGSSPEWPDEIYEFSSKVIIDKKLRVEIPKVSPGLSKKDKEAAKKEIRSKAKIKLQELAADRIEGAKPHATEQSAKESEVTVQPEQDTLESNLSKESIKEKNKEAYTTGGVDTKEKNNVSTKEKINEKRNTAVKEKTKKEDNIVPTEMNEANIIAAIKKTEYQLNGDIVNTAEYIKGTMKKNVTSINNEVTSQAKHIVETTVKIINETANTTSQRIQKSGENITGLINDTKRSISETQDKLVSKVNTVGKRVINMVESIEGIEGNLHRLDQLDTITELLQNKGLTLSMEIPPVNADEEDIINLVRYSQKITEQLGYAARDLIRKQEAFKSQEEGNANEQKMMNQKIAKAHDDGVNEGKKAFIKQLISKYEDIDTIRESENNHVHVIWTLLIELGVLIDGEGCYEKGREIDFSGADIEKLIGTYSKLDGAGKYKVVKTGLNFQGEIICKAEFEKINPDSNENKSEEAVLEDTKSQKESEEPESNESIEKNDTSDQDCSE